MKCILCFSHSPSHGKPARSYSLHVFLPQLKSGCLTQCCSVRRNGAAEVTGGHGGLTDASFYCGCQFVACKSIPNVPKSLTTAASITFYCLGREKNPNLQEDLVPDILHFSSRSQSLSSSGLLRWCSDTHPAQNNQFQILSSDRKMLIIRTNMNCIFYFHACVRNKTKNMGVIILICTFGAFFSVNVEIYVGGQRCR